MKKITILLFVFLVVALVSSVAAKDNHPPGRHHPHGEAKLGQLYLFQKCDDDFGCPSSDNGPWPIIPDNGRWGQLNYSLWGDTFNFSFEGKKLLPKKDYTLIYYPDPWPGSGLICLGSGTSNRAGNIAIHGKVETGTSLPAEWDGNYKPVPDSKSGAVGAKIWLVLSGDVDCDGTPPNVKPSMIGWTPAAYLFEYNLIVFEHFEKD
jgi:hypothetical protein